MCWAGLLNCEYLSESDGLAWGGKTGKEGGGGGGHVNYLRGLEREQWYMRIPDRLVILPITTARNREARARA